MRPYLTKFFNCELAEAYLGFLANIGTIFQNAIITLEKESTSAINIYQIMSDCKTTIEAKLTEEFYGSIASGILSKCDDSSLVSRFKREANCFMELCIDYISTKYHFSERFRLIQALKLEGTPVFSDFVAIVKDFNIASIDEDLLFEEFVKLK